MAASFFSPKRSARMDAMADVRELAARYMRLVDGFVTTQLLYVAAALDVGGRLAKAPLSGTDLAASLGVDSAALTRVLRGLVAEGVLEEDDRNRFALTPLGGCLNSLQGATIARGALYYGAAAGLLETVRDGATSFEHVHGASFFEHLRRHPDQYAVFQASMAGRAEQEARDVVSAYDFTGIRRLIDVGGGPAVLLAEILRAVPELTGILMDSESTVPQARKHLDRSGVGDRAECVPGDFFVSVPAGPRLSSVASAPRLGRRRRQTDSRHLPLCDGARCTTARGRGHSS